MAANITKDLQDTLVELIDLALQAKQYHWTITGQEFRGVHLHLDEITDEVRLRYDDVAERMAALDVAPDGRLATVAATTPLTGPSEGWQRDADAVANMQSLLEDIAGRVNARARAHDDDLVSQGILLDIAGGLAKHAWMMRASRR